MDAAPALATARPVARPIGRGRLLVWGGYALLLLVAPLVLPSNLDRSVLTQIGIGIVACLSYNMLLGQGGMLSFGHAVYTGLGTFVAVIPATILGFSQGTDTGLWTLAVLIGVQQIQGNLVMPLLQKRMVDLPPALTIFSLIAAGILFGPVGVLLATPLTVVVLVLVRRLYLGDDEPLGGEA